MKIMRKLLIVAAILTVVGVIAGPAAAGGKGSSSIQLVRMNAGLAAASASPTFGEQVTFAVSTTRTSYPWVQNRCWQSGTFVYEEWHGFWAGYYRDAVYTLGPTPSWVGGSADCEGRLIRQSSGCTMQTLATTTYHVGG
jgi:hypothetical protein